jgi:threonine dehydratase
MFATSKLNGNVITCSAGNHGKAVAYVARGATICVPRSVDQSKLDAMVRMGADVRISEFDGYDETQDWAMEMAAREKKYFLSPFDDDAVMAANGGTVAMEVLEDAPDARVFVLPVGGGGLSAGFAVWAKHQLRAATIIGCQHVLSPALRMSLDTGDAVTRLPAVETMAGGVEGGIGARTFGVLQPLVDSVALVSEVEILEGVRWMIRHHQYLIEPTAAVTIAACISGKVQVTRPVVVVVSGRNVSSETIKKILCAS